MSTTTQHKPQLSLDEDLKVIIISPPPEIQHTATVVGPIHGLGDSARGWCDSALILSADLPHCKFILPDAPISPVTLNNGYEMPSWYDIEGQQDRFEEKCKGLEDSKARITALINSELESGMPANRIAVAGFSQGGALSLVTAGSFHTQLAGCLVMSGYLAGAPSFQLSEAAKDTPVLHLHGKVDPMVKIEWARETQKRIVNDFGHRNYQLKEYDDLEHSVSVEEMSDAIAFLKKVLP